MFLPHKFLMNRFQIMLNEDLGQGDLTTALIVPPDTVVKAEIICKEPGIVAGLEEAEVILKSFGFKVETSFTDGEKVEINQIIMTVSGDARTLLAVERTTLNLLSRMSGIATTTRDLIEKIKKVKSKVKIACTRKTAPGLLYFDKKAVLVGGADTHRFHLDDMILIKDNHIVIAGGVENALRIVKDKVSFSKKIEVEVTCSDDALRAAKEGADVIMLDNFSPSQIEKTIKLLEKNSLPQEILLEASGGITSENILVFASSGVNILSLSEITNNSKALDMSLEIVQII